MIMYLTKMKGNRRTTPLMSPPPLDIIIALLGAFLGIALVAIFAHNFDLPKPRVLLQ